MDIKTGYFAKINTYIQHNYIPISIARSKPKWANCREEPYFAPNDELFFSHLEGDKYANAYRNQVSPLVAVERIMKYQKLCEATGKDGIVLLCWEKDSDECHRSVLGEYLSEILNKPILEFSEQELQIEK